jgi:hypothetical protein
MTRTVLCSKHVFGLSAPGDQSEQVNGATSTNSGLGQRPVITVDIAS